MYSNGHGLSQSTKCTALPYRFQSRVCSSYIYAPYDWLNKFYGFYKTVVVGIISGHGVSIHTRCGI